MNFDPQILQLIREAEMMVKLELEVPPLMRELLKQQGILKKNRDDLVVCAYHYHKCTFRLVPVLPIAFHCPCLRLDSGHDDR